MLDTPSMLGYYDFTIWFTPLPYSGYCAPDIGANVWIANSSVKKRKESVFECIHTNLGLSPGHNLAKLWII